jgi:antitoxin MazE
LTGFKKPWYRAATMPTMRGETILKNSRGERCVTLSGAARLIGISTEGLRAAIEANGIEVERTGFCVLVPVRVVRSYKPNPKRVAAGKKNAAARRNGSNGSKRRAKANRRVLVQKWGKSLALRIPKPFAEDVGVREGTVADVSISKGRLIATPVSPRRARLEDLLRRVAKRNLHGEVGSGPTVGREAW